VPSIFSISEIILDSEVVPTYDPVIPSAPCRRAIPLDRESNEDKSGEDRGMRAIPWPEARKQGAIFLLAFTAGCPLVVRDFWQNETNRRSFGKTKPT
jgi:hypothetical protein